MTAKNCVTVYYSIARRVWQAESAGYRAFRAKKRLRHAPQVDNAAIICVGFAVVGTAQARLNAPASLPMALVLAASIAVFIMMSGARTPLEEAHEWVCSNFRVDNDGSLCLD